MYSVGNSLWVVRLLLLLKMIMLMGWLVVVWEG